MLGIPAAPRGAGGVLVAMFVTLGLAYGFWYAYSALHLTNSLGGALGAWVAGRIFDATASYALALPIAAAMAVLAPTLLWFAAPRRPNPAPSL